MKKLFLLCLVLSTSAFADPGNPEVVRIRPGTSESDAVEVLKSRLAPSAGSKSEAFAFEIREPNRSYLSNYKNGDFVILWGVGASAEDQKITADEYQGLWRVMNFLSSHDFRVVMNVRSTGEDLTDAFRSPTSSIVVWSAHGNQTGIYDYNRQKLPHDILSNIPSNVYQFILSTCYGTQALANYPHPAGVRITSWDSTTTATALLNYLVSDQWNPFDGKNNR